MDLFNSRSVTKAPLQKWGDAPFKSTVASWYWGHARLGPFALVWFSYLPRSGLEKVSSYIARDGQILSARCVADAVRVRPTGPEAQYPPTQASGAPRGFRVDFKLEDGRVFNVSVETRNLVADAAAVYSRWTGAVEGVFDGGGRMTGGKAVLEQYVMV